MLSPRCLLSPSGLRPGCAFFCLALLAVQRLPILWHSDQVPMKFSLAHITVRLCTCPPTPGQDENPHLLSSVDRCVLSPYCGLGKTQHPFLLGAFVLAGEIDTGTGSRVATSLTCVRPASGSVRHMVDPGAVTLTRGAVNEGMGRGSGSHPRTNTYGGRSERSPGPGVSRPAGRAECVLLGVLCSESSLGSPALANAPQRPASIQGQLWGSGRT